MQKILSHDRRKVSSLLILENQDTEIYALINIFNTALTETAYNILGKHRPAKKPWVMDNILKLYNKRRELKQKKNTTEGAKLYGEANQQVKKGTRKAKKTVTKEQCQGIEENLQKKQCLERLPASERTDKLETRENYYRAGQSRSHRRTRHPEEVDRVLFRIVYTHNNRRFKGARFFHQSTMTASLSCRKKLKPQ